MLNVITYNTVVSFPEKCKPFKQAREVCEAIEQSVVLNVPAYSALINACEKGVRALRGFGVMQWQWPHMHCSDQRLQEGQAASAGLGGVPGHAMARNIDGRGCLQRSDQHLRDGQAA